MGLDSLMKASPSLITSYFGRMGAEDEEISSRVCKGRGVGLQFSVISTDCSQMGEGGHQE
jgi:hypothetical protein